MTRACARSSRSPATAPARPGSEPGREPPATPSQRRGATNERVELGRYTISAGERVIYGQRVLGVVRLVAIPVDGPGRRYVIERGLTSMAELEAIVADYLAQAAR